MTLYDELKEAGIPIKSRYSDLYCPVTPESTAIVKKYTYAYSPFLNQVEGGVWYDIPMAYEPYWDIVLKGSLSPA